MKLFCSSLKYVHALFTAVFCNLLFSFVSGVGECVCVLFSFVGFVCTHTRSPLNSTAKLFLSKLCVEQNGFDRLLDASKFHRIESSFVKMVVCVGTVFFILWPPPFNTNTQHTFCIYFVLGFCFFSSFFFCFGLYAVHQPSSECECIN